MKKRTKKTVANKPAEAPSVDFDALRKRIIEAANYSLLSIGIVERTLRNKPDKVIDAMDLRQLCNHFTAIGLQMKLEIKPKPKRTTKKAARPQ